MQQQKKQLIQPRTRTPAPGDSQLRLSARLPDDLVAEQVRRFAVFAATGAGLWTFGLVMEAVIIPLTGVPRSHPASWVIELLGIIASGLAYLYAKSSWGSARAKADASLYYMLLNAAGIAAMNITMQAGRLEVGTLSWNAILILISSMILLAPPRKILLASLVAATMDPLAVWLQGVRGVPVPSLLETLIIYMPNYACAVVAVVPSIFFQRLGHQLREAQEMGSYQLMELLGKGGMGEVWRAQHRLLARNAAIKIVRPELLGAATDSDARTMLRRFEREAQATAALSSPNTIRIFDFGATGDGAFYYVMELLVGRDLDSLVREFGPVPADRAMYLLRQVCHSLADAHARGLVHRDIKPANIYVCRLGLEYDFVKVLDFGLVKFNASRSMKQTLMTHHHTTTGTPAFMAPEIILGEGDIDRRADVYSLGCVAYYLLTGELVFDADSPMKMFMEHVQTRPTPPSQRTELFIPRDVDELVMACLEKDPAKRPQDAQELLQLTRRCRECDSWDNDVARAWWETHLIELTGPLTLTESDVDFTDSRLAVH